jgi:hypothetical protein
MTRDRLHALKSEAEEHLRFARTCPIAADTLPVPAADVRVMAHLALAALDMPDGCEPTHHAECWRQARHHACAVRRVEELEGELAAMRAERDALLRRLTEAQFVLGWYADPRNYEQRNESPPVDSAAEEDRGAKAHAYLAAQTDL